MSNSNDANKHANELGLIHELRIPLGDGISLIYNSSPLEESEWWIEFPGEHQTGLGCSVEDARLLLMAANGPKTTIGYSTAHRSDADVAKILAERNRGLMTNT